MVIGLDGGTWKLLAPLAKAGLLPNLQHVIEKGSSGYLMSTVPPITSPAWLSMVTGLNPGKLGVYGILARNGADMYSFKPVTSNVYRDKAIWDYLSEKGFKVALFKIPFLYPAYKINGCMVSGFGSLSKMSAYPSDLARKGPSLLREAAIFEQLETLKTEDTSACIRFIKQLKAVAEEESEYVLQLSISLHPDFLFYVISATDWLQHAFTDKIVEVTQKVESDDLSELDFLEKMLVDFYRSIDSIVGRSLEVLKRMGDDYFFLIVSDHGFTIRPYTFNLARWLIENDYMKLKRRQFEHSRTSPFLIAKILHLLGRTSLSRVLEYFLRILPRKVLPLLISHGRSQLKLSKFSQVDSSHSKAFCVEGGSIYVNSSIVEESFQEGLVEKLDRFLRLTCGFSNVRLRAFKKKEIYWGENVELAPDLTIEILDGDQIWETTMDPKEPMMFRPPLPGKHDYLGIFCAYGPHVKEGVWLGNLMIWDVAPTILHLFDVAVQANMDGRAVTRLFREGSDMQQRLPKRRRDERRRIRRITEKLRRGRK